MTSAHRSAALVALVLWAVFGSMAELASIPAIAQAVDDDLWQTRRAAGWRDQIGGGVHGLAVDGDRMYAVVGGRLHVYDVADAARPLRLGRSLPWFWSGGHNDHEFGGFPLVVNGDGVYAPGWHPGSELLGLDVSLPADPRLVAHPDGIQVRSMNLVGDELVTLHADRLRDSGFLYWWAVSDPAALARTRVTQLPQLDSLSHFAVRPRDRQALSVDHNGGARLHWLDLSLIDPTIAPATTLVLNRQRIPSLVLLDSLAVALSADESELLQPVSLVLLDAGEPVSFAVRSTLPLSVTAMFGVAPIGQQSAVANKLAATDTHAFVPIAPHGQPRMASIDISDRDAPRQMGTALLHGSASELRVSGDRLYVGSSIDIATTHAAPPPDFRGVEIFDIADPSSPRPIGMIDDAWNAVDVAAIGSHAFVAAAWSGLRIVDVTDRDAAVEVAALPDIGDVTAVKVVSEDHILATVASGSHQGVVTIDVSNPVLPTISGRLALIEHPEVVDVAVEGNVAVVVAYDGFVHVIDVADVAAPRLFATVNASPLPDSPLPPRDPVQPGVFSRAIAMEDGMAFVGVTADDWQQAWIVSIDVTVPSEPRQRSAERVPPVSSSTPPVVDVRDVAVAGGRVAVGVGVADNAPVRFYRADDEGALTPVSQVPRLGLDPMALAWQGDVLVSAGLYGHDAFDARDISIPRLFTIRGAFNVAPHPERRHGGLAFLADGTILQAHGTQGLLIADTIALPVTPTPTDSPMATVTPTESPPVPSLTIEPTLDPPPASTPSYTPTSTATDALTPTSVPSATLASPTTTATGDPSRIPPFPTSPPTHRATGPSTVYLPLALAESCPPKDYFIDVVLVIDASTSMRERAPDGRRKLDVVLAAVRAFADGMRLAAGQDRAAIVTFNADATLVQSLTHHRGDIEAALDRVKVAEFSRVDLGVERAAAELLIRGRAGRGQAMVVLSDGLVNPVSSAVAIEAARSARKQGITLWIVGLGPSLDQITLRAMASGPDRYQLAGDVLAVESIYHDLTRRVPCPVERYWAGR